jgi:hypothetical protein
MLGSDTDSPASDSLDSEGASSADEQAGARAADPRKAGVGAHLLPPLNPNQQTLSIRNSTSNMNDNKKAPTESKVSLSASNDINYARSSSSSSSSRYTAPKNGTQNPGSLATTTTTTYTPATTTTSTTTSPSPSIGFWDDFLHSAGKVCVGFG